MTVNTIISVSNVLKDITCDRDRNSPTGKHGGRPGLSDLLRGPVLRMAEGDEREQQRASAGVLSQRKRPKQSFGKDIKKDHP